MEATPGGHGVPGTPGVSPMCAWVQIAKIVGSCLYVGLFMQVCLSIGSPGMCAFDDWIWCVFVKSGWDVDCTCGYCMRQLVTARDIKSDEQT